MRWSVLVLLGLISLPLSAFYIHLHGVVTEYATGEGMKGVQVRLVKDSVERETVITPWNGSYELYLERGYDYIVWFYREDLVTKHVRIDARKVPLFPDVPFYDMDMQMTMFTWIESFDFGIFDRPVGKAEYKHSVRNLNWDIDYTERLRPEVARVMTLYDREVAARQKATARQGSTAKRRVNRKRANF